MTSTPYLAPATAEQLISGHFDERGGYAVRREQGTKDWLLILTLAGAGEFSRAGVRFTSAEGDFVLFRPRTPHDYRVEPGHAHWELLWVHFFPVMAWQELLRWPEEAPGLMRLSLEPPKRGAFVARFCKLHALATGSTRNRAALANNALEELLLWCDEVNPLAAYGVLDPRVRQAVSYLSTHYHEPITLSTLGHRCQLSVSRLAHLFREQVGVSPKVFLEAQRLHRAKQLLVTTQLSVAKIAYMVGFDNPYYFSRRFKQSATLSPKAYRQRFER